jgi:prevent-host-death family protein
MVVMTVIPQKELRNQIGDVLRRVEAGETMIVTVSGRPVAELSPAHRRRWVGGDALAKVWAGPTPRGLEEDLEQLPAGLVDPFEG